MSSIKEKYIDYCKTNETPLFFKPIWLDAINPNWNVLYKKVEEKEAFFIYHFEKKIQFKMIRNTHLTPYTGFLFLDINIDHHIKQQLVNELLAELPKCDELYLDFYFSLSSDFTFGDYTTEIKITNLLKLTNEDEIWNNYRPALKRQINKAKKNIFIEEIDDIKIFYSLHEKTFLKQNKKADVPFEAFEKIWKMCKNNQLGKLYIAKDIENNIHAAIFLCYDKSTSYYLAGGTDASFYGSGAMSLLMHSMIIFSLKLGKEFFDFEGSMLFNVNRFFQNFSPKEIPYFNIKKMNSPILRFLKSIKKRT